VTGTVGVRRIARTPTESKLPVALRLDRLRLLLLMGWVLAGAIAAPRAALAAEVEASTCAAALAGAWIGRVPERDASGQRTGEPTLDLNIELRSDGHYEWYTFASLEVSTQNQSGRWSCQGDGLVLEVAEDFDPRVPFEVRMDLPSNSRTDTFVVEHPGAERIVLAPAGGGYRYGLERLPPAEPDRPLEPPQTPAQVATLGYLRCVLTLGGASMFGDVAKADVERYGAWMKAQPDLDEDYAKRNVRAVFKLQSGELFVTGAYARHKRGESAGAAIRNSAADCLAAIR
jgi:hypothetical protein